MNGSREIILSADGSSTLKLKEFDECFHSINGALAESLHIFISSGLEFYAGQRDKISLFEMGFGTGLNALLTLEFAINNNKKIVYESIEAYPLNSNEFNLLNYDDFVKTPVSLQKLHEITVDKNEMVTENFSLLKHFCKIENFNTTNKFDIVYFDVFGYDFQSELWSAEILQQAFDVLNANGIFVTYACKGLINRRLKEIGFKVHKTAGPPGKREMIIAVKKI